MIFASPMWTGSGKVAGMSNLGRTVSVEFVDADTGDVIGRSELPTGQLPERFDSGSTVQLRDDSWIVAQAEPASAEEFIATGHLTLKLRRLLQVPPEEILYSLPTICRVVPPIGPPTKSADRLEMLEDHWRQLELVSRALKAEVENELAAIRRIYEQHARRDNEDRVYAFDQIHVRSMEPFTEPLPWARVRALLPAAQSGFGEVGFRGHPDVAVGSFARPDRAGWWWYGITYDDLVPVLGLHFRSGHGPLPAASVEPVLRAFDLMVVDWCRCSLVEADGLAFGLQ
jgi:hypothetical protein